jgi:putative spermidine/putrescine transport system permease protein
MKLSALNDITTTNTIGARMKPNAAAVLAFIVSFDETVVTLFLTGPRLYTLPIEVFNYVARQADPLVAALSVLLLAATAAVVVTIERTLGLVAVMGRRPA